MTSSYVGIRSDNGLNSLSINERQFLVSCAVRGGGGSGGRGDHHHDVHHGLDYDDREDHHQQQDPTKILRSDGRLGYDMRNVRLNLQRRDNYSESESTVQWGASTRVSSTCSAQLVPPSSIDRPAEGVVNFTVDLSPMALGGFKVAPPVSTAPTGGGGAGGGGGNQNFSDSSQRLLCNRIVRCLERIVLIGGALDTEALVLQAGRWVWRVTVSLTVLDAGGNLLDACVLAALASLRHYRKPQVEYSSPPTQSTATTDGDARDEDGDGDATASAAGLPSLVPSTVKEATPLPLHHTPLSISFGLIQGDDTSTNSSGSGSSGSASTKVVALIDPSDREELVQDGNLTIAANIHSEVCLLDYGGGCELSPSTLRECWTVAESAIKKLCQLLETTLQNADEQAQHDQLQRLQLLQRQKQQQESENGPHDGDFIALSLPPLSAEHKKYTPYLQEMEDIDDLQVVHSTIPDTTDLSTIQHAQTEAEEAYRKQALDYSINHLPSAVRDDDDKNGATVYGSSNTSRGRPSFASAQKQAGSLLAAMLQSVGHTTTTTQNSSTELVPNEEGKTVSVDATATRQQQEEQEDRINKTTSSSTTAQPTTIEEKEDEVMMESPHSHQQNQQQQSVPMTMDDDDEEEPTTIMLESEFGTTSTAAANTTTDDEDGKSGGVASSNSRSDTNDLLEQQDDGENNAEVDDFASAIKSKKKKSKKTKKK